jgi:hypothetical protein
MQTNAQGPARSAGSAERQKVRSRSSRMNALITQTTAAVVLGGPRSWQTATMPHHRISRVWTLPRIPAVLRGRARAFAGPGADAGPAAYRLTSGLRVSGCYRSWWWPGCCRRAGIGAACGSGPRGRERRCSRGGRSPQSAATACMASMRSSRRSSSLRASARAIVAGWPTPQADDGTLRADRGGDRRGAARGDDPRPATSLSSASSTSLLSSSSSGSSFAGAPSLVRVGGRLQRHHHAALPLRQTRSPHRVPPELTA